MTPHGDDVPATAVRPFLERSRSTVGADEPFIDPEAAHVRAYTMTKGRSQAAVHLAFETMLQATVTGRDPARHERFERSAILQLCVEEPLSVAELSARLRLPIGVVRVVAADLLVDGHLEAFHTTEHVADDVFLITRLIAGVRAL